jgi:hypothetical protein
LGQMPESNQPTMSGRLTQATRSAAASPKRVAR